MKVGDTRLMNNGLYTVWVQCSLGAAIKTANMRKVNIGWTMARVDLLDSRTQCFRCWRFGHLKHACTSKVDYSGLCFRCGGENHAARYCNAPPACKICMVEGKPFNHRLGSDLCPAAKTMVRMRSNITSAQSGTPSSERGSIPMELDGR